jgi:hypothetical protein
VVQVTVDELAVDWTDDDRECPGAAGEDYAGWGSPSLHRPPVCHTFGAAVSSTKLAT